MTTDDSFIYADDEDRERVKRGEKAVGKVISKLDVRAEIERDESVHQDALFVCFWHRHEQAVQWLEPGEAGLAQIEQQAKVFAQSGLEVNASIWKRTELRGAPFAIEYRTFGPEVNHNDVIALALSDTVIARRYVYAVCRHLGKATESQRSNWVAQIGEPSLPFQKSGVCSHCGLRKLPTVKIEDGGSGFQDGETVIICGAQVFLTSSGGCISSAKFQAAPNVPDATAAYQLSSGASGSGVGAKVFVQDLLKLAVCSQCKVASYCSVACQKAHWRIHKTECGAKAQVG